MPVGHIFYGEMSVQVFCPFFNWVGSFFVVEMHEFFIYFGDLPLIRCMVCKYLLSIVRLSFHFVNGFLCLAEAPKLNF